MAALCLGTAPVAAVPRPVGASKRNALAVAQAPSARGLSSGRASFAGRAAQLQSTSGSVRPSRLASHLVCASASNAPVVLAASAPAKAAPRGRT